jgi:hypothetical protein
MDTIRSPGEMLVKILEWKAAMMFYGCTEYAPPELSRFSPRKAHTEYLKIFKYKSPEEAIANLSKEQLRLDGYRGFCLAVAAQEARRDSYLREKLTYYYRKRAEIDAELYAQIHPRKGEPGHQWVNGYKKPLGKSTKKK